MGTTPEKRKQRLAERYAELDTLPKIQCRCGCGELIPPINKQFRPATYKHNHHPGRGDTQFVKGQSAWNKGQAAPWAKSKKGKCAVVFCPEQATSYEWCSVHYGRWKRHGNPLFEPNRSGPNNSFFGKTHTPETIERLRSRVGPAHHGWRGGVGALPYGPGFTRGTKRAILERDGNRCRRCGITQDEYGRSLQVHHLDHDKTHNDPSNLAAACGSCNVWASYHRDEPWLPEQEVAS